MSLEAMPMMDVPFGIPFGTLVALGFWANGVALYLEQDWCLEAGGMMDMLNQCQGPGGSLGSYLFTGWHPLRWLIFLAVAVFPPYWIWRTLAFLIDRYLIIQRAYRKQGP